MSNRKAPAPEGVQAGQRWNYKHGVITIMAVSGSYAMARYPRALPFVVLKKDLQWEWSIYVD